MNMNKRQIEEIGKQIIYIEKEATKLLNTGWKVKAAILQNATSRISDVMAGELGDAEKEKKERIRYFFSPKTYIVGKCVEGTSRESSLLAREKTGYCFEVTESDLPYLEKPEGEWEFRKPEPSDSFLDVGQDRKDIAKGWLWAVLEGTPLEGLNGMRWCRPRPGEERPDGADALAHAFYCAAKEEAKEPVFVGCSGLAALLLDRNLKKPPIGLKPRALATKDRALEILEAMNRYVNEGRPVPEYWREELNEKLADLKGQK